MTQDRKAIMAGGCQCGAVRYALYGQPELDRAHLCHCRMCQKAVGNAFAALVPVRTTDFAWTRGTPGIFRSSSVAERGFCPACGTPLSFGFVKSEWIDVTLGSLDQPDRVPPLRHIGIESRRAWMANLHELPERATEPGSITGSAQQVMVNLQHPDHDTDADWQPPGV